MIAAPDVALWRRSAWAWNRLSTAEALVLVVPALYLLALLLVAFTWSPGQLLYFTLDDGFFYMKTAHNVSQGLGFTFDGFNPTDGYHHLYMWLLSGVDRVVPLEGTAGLRVVLVLHGALIFAGCLAISRLLADVLSIPWRAAAVALVVASQMFFNVGTEAPLLFLLGMTFLSLVARQQQTLIGRDGSTSNLGLAVAASSALICLARSDAALFVLGPGFTLLAWHALGGRRDAVASTLLAVILPAVAVEVLGAAYNLVQHGHATTVSAYIKNDFPDVFDNSWLANKPLAMQFRMLAPVAVSLAMLLLLAVQLKTSRWSDARATFAVVWAGANLYVIAYAATLYLFTTGEGSVGAAGVQSWYFVLTMAVFAIDLVYFVHFAANRLPSVAFLPRRLLPAYARFYAAAPLVLLALVLLASTVHFARTRAASNAVDIRDDSAEAAEWLRLNTPSDARVYVIDYSGVVGYFSERSVVNGDGLINSWEYLEAVQAGRLEGWLAEHRVDYFAVFMDEFIAREVVTPEGKAIVTTLLLRGSPAYEITANTTDALYHASQAWIFPRSALRFALLAPEDSILASGR
jgi:hypothetical protein